MQLSSPVSNIPLVGPAYRKKLEKLDIYTVEDLLYHVPRKFLDFRKNTSISSANPNEILTIKGVVRSKSNFYSKSGKKVQIIDIDDGTGSMSLVFFNQMYLLKTLKEGQTIFASGQVGWFSRKKAMFSPSYEMSGGVHTGRLVPVYPTTSGITAKWLRGRINYVYPKVKLSVSDFLTKTEIAQFGSITLSEAFENAHFPKSKKSFEESLKRFSLNELIYLDITMKNKKNVWQSKKTRYKLELQTTFYKKFLSFLPFKLTNAQKRCIHEVSHDLKGSHPMNRLLQGDVGSGKTAVATFALYISYLNNQRSIMMAPTQIVANQHFNTLKAVFAQTNIKVGLVTSVSKPESIDKYDILVGTHSLFFQKKLPRNTSVVVIDEQHKFGVKQRKLIVNLITSGKSVPNVLSMTATPIPRTIALSMYGNIDLSYLDELPKDRKQISTWIVPETKRKNSYGWIEEQIDMHDTQAFVVCPLINDSSTPHLTQHKAVTSEYEKLRVVFKNKNVGLLHGKLKSNEKKSVLDKFRNKKIDILVTTPVVEVGVDVPNATIMVIETADRFGLAQLHQLRGRVGRGDKHSYCLLFSESDKPKTMRRLNVLKSTKCGFELAEADLSIRGPGEFFGTHQHGFLRLKFADIADKDQLRKVSDFVDEIQTDDKRFLRLLKISQSKVSSH
ncbi:ATP-dependent DNA helicase RecG [Patescibacteria group bacterium]